MKSFITATLIAVASVAQAQVFPFKEADSKDALIPMFEEPGNVVWFFDARTFALDLNDKKEVVIGGAFHRYKNDKVESATVAMLQKSCDLGGEVLYQDDTTSVKRIWRPADAEKKLMDAMPWVLCTTFQEFVKMHEENSRPSTPPKKFSI